VHNSFKPNETTKESDMTSEQITNDFIKQIEAGYIHPEHMACILYSMNNAMVDRFEAVALWLPTDLEQVADTVVKAIETADVTA
jgi:hypothetical protein